LRFRQYLNFIIAMSRRGSRQQIGWWHNRVGTRYLGQRMVHTWVQGRRRLRYLVARVELRRPHGGHR